MRDTLGESCAGLPAMGPYLENTQFWNPVEPDWQLAMKLAGNKE
jgi:hypothetical protein